MDQALRKKLHVVEDVFFNRYPGGFEDDEIIEIRKKHNVDKVAIIAERELARENFGQIRRVADAMIKIVSASSMVSMFEKPRFRDTVNALSSADRERLVGAMQELIHGDQAVGFDTFNDVMHPHKLAKWTLVSVIPYYYSMQQHWFIKPTTTKDILRYFEVEDLVYRPQLSYVFYRDYSAFLDELKHAANPELGVNNAAFTGFLMMGLQLLKEKPQHEA